LVGTLALSFIDTVATHTRSNLFRASASRLSALIFVLFSSSLTRRCFFGSVLRKSPSVSLPLSVRSTVEPLVTT